ncbi:MAG: hypothetical protein MUC93_08555 [Bacteroidales bacterium]|jgi:hypothetical protein|nr:hypothetical protein [Bacteroidales bacterium]
MKTIENVCVYRNLEYEQSIRSQIEASGKVLSTLLNEWLKLNIGDCTDINELVMRPERVYKNAIDKLVEVPAINGRFSVKKESHLSTLDLPDPSPLYASARTIRMYPYCNARDLWNVFENELIMNETEAQILAGAQSIFTSDPDKAKLAKDFNKLCDLLNSLNKRLNGEILPATPWTYNWCRGKFVLKQQSYNGLQEVSPDVDFLRRVVQG